VPLTGQAGPGSASALLRDYGGLSIIFWLGVSSTPDPLYSSFLCFEEQRKEDSQRHGFFFLFSFALFGFGFGFDFDFSKGPGTGGLAVGWRSHRRVRAETEEQNYAGCGAQHRLCTTRARVWEGVGQLLQSCRESRRMWRLVSTYTIYILSGGRSAANRKVGRQ